MFDVEKKCLILKKTFHVFLGKSYFANIEKYVSCMYDRIFFNSDDPVVKKKEEFSSIREVVGEKKKRLSM